MKKLGKVPAAELLLALRNGDKAGRDILASLIREREEKSLTIDVEIDTDVGHLIFNTTIGLS